MFFKRSVICGTAIGAAFLAVQPGVAETNSQVGGQIQELRQQIQNLQDQLKAQQTQDQLKQQQIEQFQKALTQVQTQVQGNKADMETAAKTAAAAATPWTNSGSGVKLTLGGFIEAATIYRSRNETSDIGSTFGNIPYKQSDTSHQSEFRETARQSRLSLLAQGDYDPYTHLSAYFEADFIGNSTTSNSGESNSYVPRMRHAYATLDQSAWGLHFLAGQTWSLVTPFSSGLTAHKEVTPLTIDAQYVPGFDWLRVPQLRVVGDISDSIHLGLSLESPQDSITSGGTLPGTTLLTTNAGGGSGGATLNPSANYSTDVAPDMTVKVAFDPGWGHYEVFGLMRAFRDRSNQQDHTLLGGGGGANMIVPIVPKMLDLYASMLYGEGIGRYGSSQLADVAVTPTGGIAPITALHALVGLVGHVTPALDTYVYAGGEKEERKDFTALVGGKVTGFGYGSPLYNNSGCDIDNSALACTGNTESVWQITAGAWDNVYKGPVGTFKVGLQYSFTRRNAFNGIGGNPSANENIIMTSVRYYPF